MISYSPAEQARQLAWSQVHLPVRGRAMTTDTQENVTVIVQNAVAMADANRPAQAKTPVYAMITMQAGAVQDPRKIGTFTEVDTGRTHKVLAYPETTGDRVTWKFEVESQREDFGAADENEDVGF